MTKTLSRISIIRYSDLLLLPVTSFYTKDKPVIYGIQSIFVNMDPAAPQT